MPLVAAFALLLAHCVVIDATAQTLPVTSGPVLPLYRELRSVGLDPKQVYKIREAAIDRDDVHIFLNDGIIAFTQTTAGKITGAYFEGEGEILVRPPDRRERASLGLFTGQGVLEERFSTVYLRFNDDTADELRQYVRPGDDDPSFVTRNDETARRLATMDAMRLAISFTSLPATVAPGDLPPPPDRVLHARVASGRLGNFDVYFDTRAPEQIVVGQVTVANDTAYYDLWMSFPLRALRNEGLPKPRTHGPTGPAWTRDAFGVSNYEIHAAIDSSLNLAADAALTGTVSQSGSRIMMFELSRYLQLKSVVMDGQSMEFIQNETIEGSELARQGNDQVAVVFPQPLAVGAKLQLTFSYSGSVLSDAGGGLFYVGARGTWYPNRGIAMATYDISFRFPDSFTLIATGKQVSLQQDGGLYLGHWMSDGPVPIAGFNLGRYIKTSATAGEVIVNSYATRGVENEMPRSQQSIPASNSPTAMNPEGVTSAPVSAPLSVPAPVAAGISLVKRAAASITSLEGMFGPFPFSSLSLTQRPGEDSQGWPGIIFLSSYVYLTPEERAAAHVPQADSVLYAEVMMPHEVAHQWFGDRVSWASYHEQWLLEAIANYVAIMLVEPHRPADAQLVLQAYRDLLARKSKNGLANVDAGPVTLGVRLSSSKFPRGYEVITYGRGTWLIHMLREMFRDASRTSENPEGSDEVFLGLLRNIYERYQGREITNADFQTQVEAVLPRSLWFENRRSLDWFFDVWVNGTVLPKFEIKDAKFAASTATTSVSATIRQFDAPDDLVTSVPVYGFSGDSKVYLGRVFAEGPETRFTLPVPPGIKRIVLDPNQTLLTAP